MSDDKMTLSEFLLWFYGQQSKRWLTLELARATMLTMMPDERAGWAETAKQCGVSLYEF